MRPTLLFTTLAQYQTDFWLALARHLRDLGWRCAFISFDDRSSEMLRVDGFDVWSASAPAGAAVPPDAVERLAAHGITQPNLWLSHERYTFALRDTGALQARLLHYLDVAGRALDTLGTDGREVVMVQELGGFVSVVASYFAARRRSVHNWFIEPSFFRGRLFFLRDTFSAAVLPAEPAATVSPEVRAYIDDTVRKQAIAIPVKDRHQYTSALRKVANVRNARRLAEKLVDKHLFGKHQEFGHIGHHVRTHVRMLLNGRRLRGRYTPLAQAGRFIYYPLHVPADMALTLRSPQYLDQLALIEYLLRIVPPTHRLAIKEHPAMIGAVDARRVRELLDRFDNLVLLPPSTNNFDVLRACDLVVSVNSKSGAEASLLGKPVLVLGDAFYRRSPLVMPIERLDGLEAGIAQALSGHRPPAPEAIGGWFEQVWRHSLPGELYVANATNIATFAGSLLTALGLQPEAPAAHPVPAAALPVQ